MEQEIKTNQNRVQHEEFNKKGPANMGPNASYIWRHDPRHLVFLLSRYKFCSKLLEGKEKVLEIGCGDGFGVPILLQTVRTLHGIDLENALIEKLNDECRDKDNCSFSVLDITKGALSDKYNAAISLDVIEHIEASQENNYMLNIVKMLKEDGVLILGTPNKFAEQYASKLSKEDHINLKDHQGLKEIMAKYFHNVFLFSMNDEVVHTGFYPMAHYLFAVGVGAR